MDEIPPTFPEDQLSEEDLAILREFDAMELIVDEEHNLLSLHGMHETMAANSMSAQATEEPSPEDLLLLFVSEVEEDVNALRAGVRQLRLGEPLDVTRLQSLGRKAHKIKGSSGTFGCTALFILARHTEKLTYLLARDDVEPEVGLALLSQAIAALESTLEHLVTSGEESQIPLTELEAALAQHAIDTNSATLSSSASPPSQMSASTTKPAPELLASPASVRVELARFERLLLHSGELADVQMPLRKAQKQVDIAVQELTTAQARLTRLEAYYSTFPLSGQVLDNAPVRQGDRVVRPASSMIANILDEAGERLGRSYVRKEQRRVNEEGEDNEQHSRAHAKQFSTEEPLYWDELEIDRYSETDTLRNVLSEAIADVAAASAQVRTAFAQLNDLLQKQMTSAYHVRRDTLSLRLTPLSTLLGRIERVMMMNDDVQQRSISFEARGETTEIEQEMLEELKNPLLRLARACVTPGSLAAESAKSGGTGEIHVWFHATDLGNEVAIELGSSMHVEGGAVDEVQDTLRRLHGSIMVQRNSSGGMSFHLRLPRSLGYLKGLLVRVGTQQVIIPFAQIQRIGCGAVEDDGSIYNLRTLLGLPAETPSVKDTLQEVPQMILHHALQDTLTIPPTGFTTRRQSATYSSWQNQRHFSSVLILYPESAGLRVRVDAVLGDIEQVVKPLPPYLRRPGIAGTVIDDSGDVLLVINPTELIQDTTIHGRAIPRQVQESTTHYLSKPQQKVVLVADDSVSIRGSLLQTLTAAGYRAVGVNDGMEALEFLLDHAPDVLLLDIEMPYLNGYDLLSIMSAHEHLARVKTIMLTSRSSEKHHQRAIELGAAAYLTKPCPHDVLLETIASLLG